MKPTLDDINESLQSVLVHLHNHYTRELASQIDLHIEMAKKASRLVAGNLLFWRGKECRIIHVSAEYDGKQVQTYYLLDIGDGNYEKVKENN